MIITTVKRLKKNDSEQVSKSRMNADELALLKDESMFVCLI